MAFFGKNRHAEKLNQLHFAVAHSFSKVREDNANMFEWVNYLHQQNEEQRKIIQDLHVMINNIPTTKEAVKHVIDNYYSFEPVMQKVRELDDKIAKISAVAESAADAASTAASKEQQDFRPELREVRSEMLSEIREMRSELKDEINRKIDSVSDEQKPVLERLRELSGRIESLEKKPTPTPRPSKPRVSKEERISNLRERIVKKVVRKSKDYVKNMLLSMIRKYERIPAMELREMLVEVKGEDFVEMKGEAIPSHRLTTSYAGISVDLWVDAGGRILKQNTPLGWEMVSESPCLLPRSRRIFWPAPRMRRRRGASRSWPRRRSRSCSTSWPIPPGWSAWSRARRSSLPMTAAP